MFHLAFLVTGTSSLLKPLGSQQRLRSSQDPKIPRRYKLPGSGDWDDVQEAQRCTVASSAMSNLDGRDGEI